jgi:hypothetical protein
MNLHSWVIASSSCCDIYAFNFDISGKLLKYLERSVSLIHPFLTVFLWCDRLLKNQGYGKNLKVRAESFLLKKSHRLLIQM